MERFQNDTVSRSGSKLAGSGSKYGKSHTECSALLPNHNFDLWFNFAFAAFVYFTINREPYRNNRQRCLEMLTFSSIRSCRVRRREKPNDDSGFGPGELSPRTHIWSNLDPIDEAQRPEKEIALT